MGRRPGLGGAFSSNGEGAALVSGSDVAVAEDRVSLQAGGTLVFEAAGVCFAALVPSVIRDAEAGGHKGSLCPLVTTG